MQDLTTASFQDPVRWQAALARHAGTFACLAQGSRIGLVADGSLSNAGRAGSPMLIWQATGEGVTVAADVFPGFERTDVDILMAADESALGVMEQSLESDLLAAVRGLIREGRLLFFARKARRELDEAGYEDLLEQLGFAFMGACR